MNARADPSGAVARVLGRLRKVKSGANGWTARCPAHDDKVNSLSISVGDDGRVLLKCHAGCEAEAIVRATELEWPDLFPRESRCRRNGGQGTDTSPNNAARVQQPGCTLNQYATAKRLPVEFLTTLNLSDLYYMGAPAVRIPYLDATGNEVAVRFRTGLDKTESADNRFRWKTGAKPCLYGLWRLEDAREVGHVTVVEGESDCHTLWRHGIPAVGVPGAANWKEESDADHLAGIDTIYVVAEPDAGGVAVKKWLSGSAIRDRARLVHLNEHKDPSALYLDDPEHFRERWRAALEAAVPWRDMAAAEAETERREAWQQCRELAQAPHILDRFAEDFRRSGVVGEDRMAKLIYLALTSRFLDRPVSVAVKGPSSGGKSFTVEKVLAFLPDDSYHALTGMSERALAYGEEPLNHRFLVIYEAAGLQGEFGSYLIRSLLSEGRLVYEFVEKTKDGLRNRRIEREGPTGLLVTTTAVRLHPENETRMLSLTVADTPAQTRAVLAALAQDNDGSAGNIDLAPWQALQTWIEGGDHDVLIPFVQTLACLVPPVAVRLRRDFKAVLNLIKAHAILNQVNRERDDNGRVVAVMDDYVVVRALVADLVSEGVEATVPATVRETVQTVGRLVDGGASEVSQAELAKALNLDRGATSRRVAAAINHGYVKNFEERKGRPARLVLGDPMPDEIDVFPAPEALSDALLHRCSVDAGDTTAPSGYRAGLGNGGE